MDYKNLIQQSETSPELWHQAAKKTTDPEHELISALQSEDVYTEEIAFLLFEFAEQARLNKTQLATARKKGYRHTHPTL